MADVDYTELQGNGFLLEAARRLAMVPEWRAKPHKLTEGHADYCTRLVRYLVKAYQEAEGLPVKSRHDLLKELEPRVVAMKEAVQDGKERRLVAPERLPLQPPKPDPSFDLFCDQLNMWHCELATAVDGMRYVLNTVDFDSEDHLGSVAHVVQERAAQLVASCPYPPRFKKDPERQNP